MSLREELPAQEYEERTKPRGFVYFTDPGGQVVAKTCRECGQLKHANNYHYKSHGLGQLGTYCRACVSERDWNYYVQNRERVKRVIIIEKGLNNSLLTCLWIVSSIMATRKVAFLFTY